MILGKKSILRALEPGDVPSYHQWINDVETNYWRGLSHPMSEAQARSWIELESQADAEKLTLAIDTQNGEFVGIIGLRGICPRSRRAEIWIYLGNKDRWRQGIGTDAIATLCRYAFEQLNLHRLWLECEPENFGAVRCYEKNNFLKEGIFRDGYYRHGGYRDTVVMALLKTDWVKI